MAVAHSSASESHTGSTGSTSQASFSWTHTQTGTPQGVLVFVHTIHTSNFITSVTYGSVTLERVTGAVAIDTAGEPGRTDFFFAGSGLSSGNQTVTVTRTNNGAIMYASAATVTAGADVNVAGFEIREENQSFSEVDVDDGSSGIDGLRYAAAYYGGSTPAQAGPSSSSLTEIDLGAYGNSMVVETTAGQGSRPVGFRQTDSDDFAAVFVAIGEVTDVGSNLLAEDGSFAFVGNNASFQRSWNLSADRGSFAFVGKPATLTKTIAYEIDAEVGTFALFGNAANLAASKAVSAEAGNFVLSGNQVVLTTQRNTFAATGNFVFTGNSANLVKTGINAETANFALTGNDAQLKHQYQLLVSTGSFALTGNDAATISALALQAETGSFAASLNNVELAHNQSVLVDAANYTVNANDAQIFANRILGASLSAFALSGNNADLAIGGLSLIVIEKGNYSLSGNNAELTVDKNLNAEVGSFVFTGNNVSPSKSIVLNVAVASFNLGGNNASFNYYRIATVDALSLSLALNPAGLQKFTGHSFLAQAGNYTFDGKDAELSRTRFRRKQVLIF